MTLMQFNNKLIKLHKSSKLEKDEIEFITDNRFKNTEEIYKIIRYFNGFSSEVPFENFDIISFNNYKSTSVKLYNHLSELKG